LRDWLANLEPRERGLVLAGAVLSAIIIFWGLIWAPLQNRTAELTETVGSKQQMLTTLQRARALAATSGPQLDASTRQSLVLLVDQTHRSYGLEGSLSRNQPDGSDGIRVTFQDAGFDGLIAWLGALQSSYGVAVESATIEGARAAGVVNATVVLRRS
jgi:general secretion pathway protein M